MEFEKCYCACRLEITGSIVDMTDKCAKNKTDYLLSLIYDAKWQFLMNSNIAVKEFGALYI